MFSNEQMVLIMVLLLSNNGCKSSKILKMNQTETKMFECLGKMYNRTSENLTLIASTIGSKTDILFNLINFSSIVLLTQRIKTTEILFKFHMYIIIIETANSLHDIFENLYNSPFLNSRAKFLVGYIGQEDIENIFRISWKYFVYNINVVARKNNSWNVYSFFPYKNGNCGFSKAYELLSKCDANLEIVFPKKIPFDLNGCEVKLLAYRLPPYVIDVHSQRNDPNQAGVEVTIIHTAAERMNITEKYLPHQYKHWGYKYNDGSFSLMYKELKNHQTDIIFGFVYGNSSYSKDFEASYSHLMDNSVWWFPTATRKPHWKNLPAIFETKLWIAIFLVTITNGLFWWIFGKGREKSQIYNDITLSILASLCTLLQGSIAAPKIWKLRIVFILWLLSSVLLYAAHQCQLVSFLTSPLYERQMTTLEELIESGNEFGFYPTIADAHRSNSSTDKVILRKFQHCPLTPECLNRTAFQKDYAVVKNRRQVLYLMPRLYTLPNGRPMLYDTNIVSFMTRERYVTIKGFPLLDRLDSLLVRMVTNGLINKWDADIRSEAKIQNSAVNAPLTIGHLETAFYVYSIGMIVSMLMFVLEMCYCRFVNLM